MEQEDMANTEVFRLNFACNITADILLSHSQSQCTLNNQLNLLSKSISMLVESHSTGQGIPCHYGTWKFNTVILKAISRDSSIQFTPLHKTHFNIIHPSHLHISFPTKMLYRFLVSPLQTICPSWFNHHSSKNLKTPLSLHCLLL
jgi:hypothetical protein